MKTYSISKLAKAVGLSRTTLLYYDQIGLFTASGRTASGYRVYREADRRHLEKICRLRETGLPLAEIQRLLQTQTSRSPFAATLRQRMSEIGEEIANLKNQQRLLSAMLKNAGQSATVVDKQHWVEMMRKAGLDDAGLARWHGEYERRAPEGHHEFLASLGISEEEIQSIRRWSAGK